jgi:hypothetical protein
MNLLSNMSLNAVMIVVGALLLTAAVACNSDDREPTQVASYPNTVMADDDAMMEHSTTKFSVVIENVGGIFDLTSNGVGVDAPVTGEHCLDICFS